MSARTCADSRRISLRRPPVLFAIALATGCAPHRLYEGAARPAADVAVIRSVRSPVGGGCFVRSANGQPVIGIFAQAFEVFPVVELPPGEHVLSIGMQNAGAVVSAYSVSDCSITLQAQADHQYEVHCEIGRKTWRAWLIDTSGTTNPVPCLFPDVPPFVPPCGDSVLRWSDEQCDDGNTASGDGCSATCMLETPWPRDVVAVACAGAAGDAVDVNYASPVGQTFTPRAPRLAAAVVYASSQRLAPLELRVRRGTITGPVVASNTSSRDLGHARLFVFDPPVVVTPGEPHVLELRAADAGTLWATAAGCGVNGAAYSFGDPVGVAEGTSFLFVTFAGPE